MATEEVKPNPDRTLCSHNWRSPLMLQRSSGASHTQVEMAIVARSLPTLIRGLTPTGSTNSLLLRAGPRTYQVSTVSSMTRMKRGKLIQTGKVLVTCTLTITGQGCHVGSGEDWADEENAMTAAEAQAFKRPRVVTPWDATCTTSPRCGCSSTNIASLSIPKASELGATQRDQARKEPSCIWLTTPGSATGTNRSEDNSED